MAIQNFSDIPIHVWTLAKVSYEPAVLRSSPRSPEGAAQRFQLSANRAPEAIGRSPISLSFSLRSHANISHTGY
jgi:hypothetical protein